MKISQSFTAQKMESQGSERKMLVIHQPNYFPSAKVMAKILCGTELVILDTVQFVRREWQSRSKILLPCGQQVWLTIPISKYPSRPEIRNAVIVDKHWKQRHLKTIRHAYSKNKFFQEIYEEICIPSLEQCELITLGDVGCSVLSNIIQKISPELKIHLASKLKTNGLRGSYLLSEICNELNAAIYLAGTGSIRYMTTEQFSQKNISVSRHHFDEYPAQKALWYELFKKTEIEPLRKDRLNVLDLLFSIGPRETVKILCGPCSSLNELTYKSSI